ncbi:hypothetical protein DXG01_004185 [Tephrocybe rancida]|nr:hypothetical protein DXG01_004185 [Tephrocybe rancida]
MAGPSDELPVPLPVGLVDQPQDTSISDMDNLRTFFEYSLPELLPHPKDHTSSEETRDPATFDQHLPNYLRLHNIVYLPSMVTELENIAENALGDYLTRKGALPPTDGLFPSHSALNLALEKADLENIINEEKVVHVYEKLAPKFCAIVAATLEFQRDSWGRDNLKWSSKSNYAKSKAIADGFLQLTKVPMATSGKLSEEYQAMIKNFPIIGVWEFKSLVAGRLDLLRAFRSLCLQEQFSWTGCTHGDNCVFQCKNTESTYYPLMSWAPMGYDATEPVCGEHSSTPPASFSLPDDFDKAHMQHATVIAQQVFAEMVIHDTTFGSLSTGRYDIFLRRDRSSGEMGITDIIDTTSKGYAKQLVGLFIAMLRDARQRSNLLKTSPEPVTWTKQRPEKLWYRRHAKKIQHEILHEIRHRKVLMIIPDRKIGLTEPKNLAFAQRSPYLRLYPLPQVSTILEPTEFLRFVAHPRRRVTEAVVSVSDRQFEGLPDFEATVYLKHAGAGSAFDSDLSYHECSIYNKLRRDKGACSAIPEILGFFGHANTERVEAPIPYTALVLENVGSSVISCKQVSLELEEQCKTALGLIHEAGVLHGRICLSHFIIRNSEASDSKGPISIISFGHSRYPEPGQEGDRQKELEVAQLAYAFRTLKDTLKEDQARLDEDDGDLELAVTRRTPMSMSYDQVLNKRRRLELALSMLPSLSPALSTTSD